MTSQQTSFRDFIQQLIALSSLNQFQEQNQEEFQVQIQDQEQDQENENDQSQLLSPSFQNLPGMSMSFHPFVELFNPNNEVDDINDVDDDINGVDEIDEVDEKEVYIVAMENIILTDKNYDNVCKRILEMLENNEMKSMIEITESRIVGRLFEYAMNEEITKEKIIAEENKICSFLVLMCDIYSTHKELRYLFKGMFEKILDIYEKYINIDHGIPSIINDENINYHRDNIYFLAGLDQEITNVLIERQYHEKIIKHIEQIDAVQTPSKYGVFRPISIDIHILTQSQYPSLKSMCKKLIDVSIIGKIHELYTTIYMDDIWTKFNFIKSVVNIVEHGFINREICKFIAYVLEMNEINLIEDTEEEDNYNTYMGIACSTLCDILNSEKLNEEEKIDIVKNLDYTGHNINMIVNKTSTVKFSDENITCFKKLLEIMTFYLSRQNEN